MIAHLIGKILFRGSRYVIVDVLGTGYKIFMSSEGLKSMRTGEEVRIFTHLHVRENALELYGFGTMAELEFFEMLIGISGIGPKSAIGILSVAPLDILKRAIGAGDAVHLIKVSGIGRKIAEKVIVELRDKLAGGSEVSVSNDDADALDALTSLGYREREAREALHKVSESADTLDKKIKAALKILGSAAK